MNAHELNAWNTLRQLGAATTQIAGRIALDLRPIRIRSQRRLCQFVQAVVEVAGRSGSNSRHQDRYGAPIYIVNNDGSAKP